MDSLRAFLQQPVFSNTLQDYLVGLAVGLWIWLVQRMVIRAGLSRLAKVASRTATGADDFAVRLIGKNIGPLVQIGIALYCATRSVTLPRFAEELLARAFLVILTVTGVRIAQDIVIEIVARWTNRTQPHTPMTTVMLRNLATVVRFVLWSGALLFVMGNMGVNVTAAIAGLGVGGIAVALAVQHLLGDAVSSFAIFLDRPFEVGDFIVVGEQKGTVEYIGFKTTRLRSLSGEQLVFGNRDLEGSRIQNFKRMSERRHVFTLGVMYDTPSDLLIRIPSIIESIVREQKLARFDRAHFQDFGDFALVYEVVYFILSADYNVFMDARQAINLRIKEEFEKAGVAFAYPTQTVYLKNSQGA